MKNAKVGFIVGFPDSPQPLYKKLKNLPLIVSSWEDIKKQSNWRSQSEKHSPTYKLYRLVRCLELNEEFIEDTQSLRKRLNISPSDIGFGILLPDISTLKNKVEQDFQARKLYSNLNLSIQKLTQKLKINLPQEYTESVFSIFLQTNCVVIPADKIFIHTVEEPNDYLLKEPSLIIRFSERVTETELLNAVKAKFRDIDRYLGRYIAHTSKDLSVPSERDIEVYRMHLRGMSYTEIADKIDPNFENENMNPETIKQACNRTRQFISSLYSKT